MEILWLFFFLPQSTILIPYSYSRFGFGEGFCLAVLMALWLSTGTPEEMQHVDHADRAREHGAGGEGEG